MDVRRARNAVSKNRASDAANASPPSEAWLFAQAILGNPVPDAARAASDARAAQERRDWADAVAPDRDRSNDPPADVSAASKPSEAWLFAQEILGKPVIDRQELLQFVADITGVSEGAWDPSKHPRGGFSQNRGWWSPTGGADAAGNIEPNEGKSSGSPAASPQAPATKPQLPADHRGSWIKGTKGDGVFRYNNSMEN